MKSSVQFSRITLGLLAVSMVIFMASCNGGDEVEVTNSGPTPMTWTAIADSGFGASAIRRVEYINNRFVATGDDGKIAHSVDGITWTAVADTKMQRSIRAIAYGDGKYVAGGLLAELAYSEDLVNWTSFTSSSFDRSVNTRPGEPRMDILYGVFGMDRFVFSATHAVASRSSDGLTWTNFRPSDIEWYDDMSGLAYGGGRFVIGGGRGAMAYSPNGATWIRSTETTSPGDISAIAFGDGVFVATGRPSAVIYSEDGNNWSRVPGTAAFFSPASLNGLAFGNGRFVTAGTRGCIAHSEDGGLTWTMAAHSTFGSSAIIYDLAYGNGKFVAVGQNGQMAYSIVLE